MPDGRPALFADDPKDLIGLSSIIQQQADKQVEDLEKQVEALALTKQLADNSAPRDAKLMLLQRRAEEEERLLERLLEECKVSNLDIENCLCRLEVRKFNENGRLHGLTQLSSQASDLGVHPYNSNKLCLSGALHGLLSADTGGATLEGRPANEGDPGMVQAWKDHLKYSSGSTGWLNEAEPTQQPTRLASASNTSTQHRQALAADLVQQPLSILNQSANHRANLQEDLQCTLRRQANSVNSDPRKPTSISAWAVKLVAGTSLAPIISSANEKSTSSRVVTVSSDGSLNPRKRPGLIVRTDEAERSARRTTTTSTASATSSRRSIPPALEFDQAFNKIPPEYGRNKSHPVLPFNSPSKSITTIVSNSGPVEMDTILPEDNRPPTLAPYYDTRASSGYLTDRFGFIYDQRRRKRQDEDPSFQSLGKLKSDLQSPSKLKRNFCNTESRKDDVARTATIDALPSSSSRLEIPLLTGEQTHTQPQKQLQDYAKPTNLSLESPPKAVSIAPCTDTHPLGRNPVLSSRLAPIRVWQSGSEPDVSKNPAPTTTHAVSDIADIARPPVSKMSTPGSAATDQPDLVRSLLHQLTEAHDALQRDKSIRWNDFLRKIRAERRRNCAAATATNQYRGTAMPETFLSDGEIIGIAGLGNNGKVGRAKWTEFRNLVLSGIPVIYRAKVWAECSGVFQLRIPGYYEELVKSNEKDNTIVQQIQMDIGRTLTDNIYFRKGYGVQKLSEVLLAYARRNPEIGYCQGMNLIAANLLLILPTAEESFWMLTSMIENILPEKYYDKSLLSSRADQIVLRQYVSQILPDLSAHFEYLGIELEAVTFQWFLSVFTDCLSAEALFRVWDIILCTNDGATFLFQVALALLKLNEKSLLAYETPAEVYSHINQKMNDHAIGIDGLIRTSEALKRFVRREQVIAWRKAAVKHEYEMNRQQEVVRRGKGKAFVVSTSSEDAYTRKHEIGEITAEQHRKTMRIASLDDDDYYEGFGELTLRTPMPIDEEALWRA